MDGNFDSIFDGNSFSVKNIYMPYVSILNNEMELVTYLKQCFRKIDSITTRSSNTVIYSIDHTLQ